MKKTFRYYTVVWAVLLALFNVIAFVSVGWAGMEKYTPSFWIGYVLITLTFIGQLICAYFALKEEDLQRTFYSIPLLRASYTGLILSFVFGGLCMLISALPYWVGIVLCVIVLALNVIAVVKASAAIDLVGSVDEKVKTQTFFIKSLSVDAEGLSARAKSAAVKAECKKVCEAVRFSDPMSCAALSSIEGEITIRFAALARAVAGDDAQAVTAAAKELMILLDERNKKCKLMK